MYTLAEHYKVGTYFLSGVCIGVYVGVSILAVKRARKNGKDIAIKAMLPVYHLKYLVGKTK